jgi:ketosteroid isomerase-like protein
MVGFGEVLEQYHRTLAASSKAIRNPHSGLWSKRDDVTLANPFGPPVRGWNAVRETSERAASQVTDGGTFSVEGISTYATTDLAYALEIHRFRATLDGADEAGPVFLRVTTIFRREDDRWRIVHRHADSVTGERPG